MMNNVNVKPNALLSAQPWLKSAWADCLFILMPSFLSLLLVACFPEEFKISAAMPLAYWVVLVVFVDVAHVYSTLYRTYFNPKKFKAQHSLLIGIPLFCYLLGVMLYAVDGILFWRVLAYMAVFHFIRQQYGFMRLYSRAEQQSAPARFVDSLAVYTASIYPLLYWHFAAQRNFSWFVKGDFLLYQSKLLSELSTWGYCIIIAAYILKEILFIYKKRQLNIPRNLLIVGTFISWYFGIVYFNGDMAFTTLNVISHGIPYIALIWFFEKQDHERNPGKANTFLRLTFNKYGVLLFLSSILVFAYLEEGLWDGLIWNEHHSFFRFFSFLPMITENSVLIFLVPLLALPQFTHYVLDGFIWRGKAKRSC